MELSIIIPVYNVEAYIEKCVQSLQQQDIPKDEYELIIINDGSPDNSREVELRLMNTFSNIVFIEQENRGVSLARNAGIDRARGKYLLFIDPDDCVEPHTFSRVLKAADEQYAEVIFLGYKFLNADNSVKREVLFAAEKGKVYPGIKVYTVSRGDGTTDPDRSWAILFDRDFINRHQLRNIANVPYLEDGEFLARVLCLAERCIFEGNSFYIRTTRPGSATNSRLFNSDRAINGFFNAADSLKRFKERPSLKKEQVNFLNRPIIKFTLLIVQACVGKGHYYQYKEVKKRLKINGFEKLDLTGCFGLYYRYGLLFNISNDLFYWAWTTRLFLISVRKRFLSFL